MTQKQMSVKIDLHQQQLLVQQVDQQGGDRERARLASLSLRHAGDWLNTPPLTALGLHLRAAEFVLAVKYRLGLPVFNTEGPCPACLRPSDTLGDHALCCGTGGERISRHNNLRDALFNTAVAAGLGPVREERFLLPAATTPALTYAYDRKMQGAAADCRRQGLVFFPLVLSQGRADS